MSNLPSADIPAPTPQGRILYASGPYRQEAKPRGLALALSQRVPPNLQAALATVADATANPAERSLAARNAAAFLSPLQADAMRIEPFRKAHAEARAATKNASDRYQTGVTTIQEMLARAYRNPKHAQLVLNSLQTVHGTATAAQRVSQQPDLLGPLKGGWLVDRATRTTALTTVTGTYQAPGLSYWIEETGKRKREFSEIRDAEHMLAGEAQTDPGIQRGLVATSILNEITEAFGARTPVTAPLLQSVAHEFSLLVTPAHMAEPISLPPNFRAHLQDQMARQGRVMAFGDSADSARPYDRYQQAREIVIENDAAVTRLQANGEDRAANTALSWFHDGEQALVALAEAVLADPAERSRASVDDLQEIEGLVAQARVHASSHDAPPADHADFGQ